MSLTEAARLMDISRTFAWAMVRNGTFPVPTLRIGRLVKVNRQQLYDFLENGGQVAAEPAPVGEAPQQE